MSIKRSKHFCATYAAMIALVGLAAVFQTVEGSTNSTDDDDDDCEGTKLLGQLSAIVIFLISTALGTDVTIETAKFTLKEKKKAVLFGWCSQFGFMPLICYIFCRIFDYGDAIAIGCILTGAAPGGTTSNLATFFSLGDITLSIIMSTASTICSFFMLPILIALYVETTYTDEGIEIDWGTLVYSLLLILIPVALGMALRHYNTKMTCCGTLIYKVVAKIGTTLGTLVLLVLVLLAVVTEKEIMDSGWEIWIPALLLQPLGFSFGYGISSLSDLSRPEKRTVSLETGMQNYAVPIAIVTLNFGDQCGVLRDSLRFPFIATVMYVVTSISMVVYYRAVHAANDPPGTRPPVPDEPICICCCPQSCGDGIPSRRLGSVNYREPAAECGKAASKKAKMVAIAAQPNRHESVQLQRSTVTEV